MKFFYVLLLACAALNVQAQDAGSSMPNPKVAGRTSFYAEIGGAGILFSANIDHRFKPSHLGLGMRGGVGFVSTYEENDLNPNSYGRDVSILTLPVQLNYIFGKENSHHTFEVGGGLTLTGRKIDPLNYYEDRKSQVFGNFSFMYRRQPKDGGFMWRIGFTPLVSRGYIQPFGGVSIGYSF